MAITEWYDMMPHTITHRAALGKDAYGKVNSWGAPTSYRARISSGSYRRASRITGDDVIASTVIWCPVISALAVDDEITLPDGSKPLLIDWQIAEDENGPHHMKLWVR